MHMLIFPYTDTCIHISARAHTHMHTHIHTYVYNTCSGMKTINMHKRHTQHTHAHDWYVCVFVCVYAGYVCMCAFVSDMCLCARVCVVHLR